MPEPEIGLTLPQIQDLQQLADRLRNTRGDLADSDVWFARYTGIYLARLALDAATEKLPQRPTEHGISTRVTPEVRRSTLSLIQNSLGRSLTAEDLLGRLKTMGTLEDAIVHALHRDIGRLGERQP